MIANWAQGCQLLTFNDLQRLCNIHDNNFSAHARGSRFYTSLFHGTAGRRDYVLQPRRVGGGVSKGSAGRPAIVF